jgi:serine/threonine protein kinase
MSEQVPGYRVLNQIGEGGFSVVYLAYQEHLDRPVALKVLSISTFDKASMHRFQRECKIAGRLADHPNVVTVLDTGMTRSGRPYIAMEYFEHGSLLDRLEREGPLPVAEVLRIGVKLAGALAATHEIAVLHRDVKPQNILVSRYGEPALADFGIARLVDSFDSTRTNAFTPYHAAPEVLQGRSPGVGSDLYSLGSTLYQLLAGQTAFDSLPNEGIAQLMLRILSEPPPPIARDDLPRPVSDAIGQAMAKAPEHRFPNAVAFAQRLRQLQGELGLPVTDLAYGGGTISLPAAVPAQSPPAGPASGRRRRGLLVAGAVALTAGVSIGVVKVASSSGGSGGSDGSDGDHRPTSSATTPSERAGGTTPAGPQRLTPQQISAAAPRRVRIVSKGTSARLRWSLPANARRLPIIVQQSPFGRIPITSAGTGGITATIGGLKPHERYCFRVGALLASGSPPTIAWSGSRCGTAG